MEQYKSGAIRRIDYQRTFPWVHAFRAFRIAINVRMLLVAAGALLALALGDRLIDELPFSTTTQPVKRLLYQPFLETHTAPGSKASALTGGLETSVVGAMVGTLAERLAEPFVEFAAPGLTLLQSLSTWSQVAEAWTRLLWRLAVLALFAAILTRIAAVQFARGESPSLNSALAFAQQRWVAYFTAPLLPLAGIGVLSALCMVGGWIARIPHAGPLVVGVLWVIPLTLGFVMALLVIGSVFGWPLMYGAISAEGSDGFDGFSRSFNYVMNRPWHLAWNSAVLAGYGIVVTAFVVLLVQLVTYLSQWGVRIGLGAETDALTATIPVRFWLVGTNLLLSAFVFSYVWSAATINFFLLRLTDDATPLTDVYLPEDDGGGNEEVPLAGVAASTQPVIERPVRTEPPNAPADG